MNRNCICISVNNVSKKFRIQHDKKFSLKEKILSIHKKKQFEEFWALKDISLQIPRGSTVGLIGKNGSGKSTLLKLLTKIIYPTQGNITTKGRVSSLLELGAGFHPDFTGLENIYNNAAIFGLTKREIDSRIKRIIEFSELERFIENPIRTYSSGMYARLAFSVAINVDADILLIDEVLAVGDINFQQKCFNKLEEIRNSNVTVVIVTHDLGTVQKICNYAVWINEGKISCEGDPDRVVETYKQYMNSSAI